MLFILLFLSKSKFSLSFSLFVKIIINLKVIFNLNRENKKNKKVFLKKENIKIKLIFL